MPYGPLGFGKVRRRGNARGASGRSEGEPAVAPAPSGPPHLTRGRFSMADRSTRLATIMLGWNVLQHSYPYFDFVKTSWSVALSTALQEAATDKDEREFVATLRRMVVALHDGQARVIASGPVSRRTFARSLPLRYSITM